MENKEKVMDGYLFNLKFTVSKTGLKMLYCFYFHYFLYNSLHIHDFHSLWHAKRFKSCGF